MPFSDAITLPCRHNRRCARYFLMRYFICHVSLRHLSFRLTLLHYWYLSLIFAIRHYDIAFFFAFAAADRYADISASLFHTRFQITDEPSPMPDAARLASISRHYFHGRRHMPLLRCYFSIIFFFRWYFRVFFFFFFEDDAFFLSLLLRWWLRLLIAIDYLRDVFMPDYFAIFDVWWCCCFFAIFHAPYYFFADISPCRHYCWYAFFFASLSSHHTIYIYMPFFAAAIAAISLADIELPLFT